MALDPRVVGVAAATVLASSGGYSRLAASAMSMRSVAVRDVMARVLVPDMDYRDFRDAVRAGTVARPRDAVEAKRWVLLALTIGHQQLEPDDTENAIAMFGIARTVLSVAQWERQEARALVGLLWLAGRSPEIDTELIDQVEPLERAFLTLDLIGVSDGISSSRWLEGLNAILSSRDLAPIGLDNAGDSPFDWLSSTVEPASVNGPLVTVIMSAYRPQTEIFSAVRSILEQTWADLELLVVDDASGPEFDRTFERLSVLDARITVLRQPVNRGTYAARNLALSVSSGEFVTFQDADDWSHPERIERQVRPLLADLDYVSTHSACVRASPELVFQRLAYPAYRRLNASSHLFRRTVLDRLGGFDRVRKGADTEFHRRLEAVFPRRSLRVWAPLAFVRLGGGSLSRTDFLPGWVRPDRAEYRDAMLFWHKAIEGGADPRLSPGLEPWPLTAPRDFLRGSGVELTNPDVLAVADWTMDDSLHRATVDEVRNLAESGVRTGVVHARSIRAKSPAEMYRSSRSVRQAISAGDVEAVSLEDKVHVPTVVVVQPDVLQFPTSVPLRVSADRVEIVDDGREGVHWARADVERVARDWFGVEPSWRPEPQRSVDPAFFRIPRNRFRAHRPVVGWIAEADGSDLPTDTAVVRQVYPSGAARDVRLLGVSQPLSGCGIAVDRTWLVYESEDVTAREFWNQVDFAVAAPSNPRRRGLERTVSEALAAGCVVVLPPQVASWFGNAVVAAEPADMARVVQDLHDDRAAYVEQVNVGRSWLRDTLSG